MYVNAKRNFQKTFEVELCDDNEHSVKINVLPPRVKDFEKFEKMDMEKLDNIEIMRDFLLETLNRNKEKTLISEEFFDNAVDIISFNCLFEDLIGWINCIEKN